MRVWWGSILNFFKIAVKWIQSKDHADMSQVIECQTMLYDSATYSTYSASTSNETLCLGTYDDEKN